MIVGGPVGWFLLLAGAATALYGLFLLLLGAVGLAEEIYYTIKNGRR